MAATKPIKVLTVEDLQIAQKVAIKLLTQLNCAVQVAANGATALEKLFMTHYDFIFIDIQLPDISGFELAKTIRDIQKQKNRSVLIAVTADSNEELAHKTKISGFDDYLLKPLSIETLRHVLEKHSKRAHQNRLNAA